MITERVELTISAGHEADFEVASARALPLLEAATGTGAVALLRGVEQPSTYLLLVEWGAVDDHTAFTTTETFVEFGSLIKPFLAEAPSVAHFETVGAPA